MANLFYYFISFIPWHCCFLFSLFIFLEWTIPHFNYRRLFAVSRYFCGVVDLVNSSCGVVGCYYFWIDVYGRLLSASYCSIELSAIELKERATKKKRKKQIIHQTRFHIFMEIYENIFLFICVWLGREESWFRLETFHFILYVLNEENNWHGINVVIYLKGRLWFLLANVMEKME